MDDRRLLLVLSSLCLALTLTTRSDALPVGIQCPSGTKPSGGWPLVFTWNGNCFKSVSTGGLAGDAASAIRSAKIACTATVSHSDIRTAADIDAMIRTKVVPLITHSSNQSYVNRQKIGALGFSAGGTMASYLGTKWAKGIDPANGTNNNFRVGAVVNLYGPLRMDRTAARDGSGNDIGGGGLFYLHENRKSNVSVDIPNIRQWDSPLCFCAARGTSPCQCNAASVQYYNAYFTAYNSTSSSRVCSFYSDEANLVNMSVTRYIAQVRPTHVAAMYLCSGWKDSNVDHDMNVHQAYSWWRPEHSMVVTADDGHGFPLTACEAAADLQGVPRPLAWLSQKLATVSDFPPVYR